MSVMSVTRGYIGGGRPKPHVPGKTTRHRHEPLPSDEFLAWDVGGVRIQPGDLIHADRHGVQTIPKEIAAKIADGVKQVDDWERPIIEFCKSKEFSVEGLKKIWASVRG